jgi:hypothetical protein
MNTNELFIVATQIKLRFQTSKGALTVEDLWDLPLTSTTGKVNLDQLAITAYGNIDSTPTVSFVSNSKVKSESTDVLRLDILKHIIDSKQASNAITLNANNKAEEKRQLLTLLQQAKLNALGSLSEEELTKRIAAL